MSYEQSNILEKYVIKLTYRLALCIESLLGALPIVSHTKDTTYGTKFYFLNFVVLPRLILRLFLPSFSAVKGRLPLYLV